MIRHERPAPRLPLRRILIIGATLIVIYFVIRSLSGVAQSLLLAFFGVLLSVMLDVPTTAMAQRMPRALALLLVLLALVSLVAGGVVLVMPTMARQAAALAHALPRGLERAGELWSHVAPAGAGSWTGARARVVAALPSLASRLVPFVNGTVSVLTSLLVVVAIALFVSGDPRAELRWIARLVPPRHEDAYWELVKRLGATVRQWLLGMIVTLAIVATLTGIGLWIVGVPSWLALALLTFVSGFVPYLGSIFTGFLVLGAGLASSPRTALLGLLVFVTGQVLQGALIAPLVSRRATRMPPALLLAWQLVMVASFGVLGVLAAQPLLVVTMVLVEFVYVEHRLGRAPES
jgi:predicted PurR-regulated permease PerM